MVDVVSYDGGRIVDFGARVRIERRAHPEQEPMIGKDGKQVIDPVTGRPLTRDVVSPDGKRSYVWVVYQKLAALTDEKGRRIHPVLGHPTSFSEVWVPRAKCTEDEARALAERIAGGED